MIADLRAQLQQSLGAAYTLEEELGGGGMSRVFVATDTKLKRRVVVKVLSPELTGLSAGRFEREIGLAASLQQANIVPVISSGDVNGLPFYTMPFIEGRSLRARLAEGPVPIGEVVSILRDVARALSYAHDRKVVHRDIKPDNVLLSGDTAVVTDFGIAKAIAASSTDGSGGTLSSGHMTALGTTLGTPAYMAPEQAAADPSADHRADLYAFGCVAYELLAGRPPFDGLTPQRLLAAHFGETPRPVQEFRPDTPPALAALVALCLEKEADRRPQQARDVLPSLESITSGSGAAMPAVLLGRETSLIRALVIWAAAFGATYILARAAIVGIGLPDWVLPGALIVAALGLPAVLATHFVQRTARRTALATPTLTPGGSRVYGSAVGTMALKASPHMTWTRTWRAGVVAGGAFVALVAGFMILRALGIGSAGSLFAKGVIEKNGRVVLAQVATRGADSSIASALTEALRADLAQSRVITLLQPSAIRAALTLMQRPADTPLDATLAREVAQREGARVVIVANVAPLGAGFLVTAQLLEPSKGDPLASITEQAKGADDLMAAVGRISRQIRGKIGESLRSVQNSPPLERVSTSSLEAFRKYDEAIRLTEGTGKLDADRGYTLLKEAVTIDTTFAMAYRKLGWVERNPVKQQEYLAKAFQYRDRLSDVERYQAEGLYYWLAAGDLDRAIESHREAFRIDSTVPRLPGNLAQLYYLKRQYDSSLAWADRVARANSTQVDDYKWTPLVTTRRFDEADSIDARMAGRAGETSAEVLGQRLVVLWGREEWDDVAESVRAFRGQGLPGQAQMLENRLRLLRGQPGDFSWVPRPFGPFVAAAFDALFRDKQATAGTLDGAMTQLRIDTLPSEMRNFYLYAATTYAVGGLPAGARRLVAKYDAEVRDTLQKQRQRALYSEALGWIALAEARPGEAIAQFHRALGNGLHECPQCLLKSLGLAHENAGARDSAIAYFERAVNETQSFYPVFLAADVYALSYRRLGDLYEQQGDTGKAVANYTKFVNLWAKADPDLQPKVADVRARLKRLAQTERN